MRLVTAALAAVMAMTAVAASAQERVKMATIAPGSSAYLVMTTMASIVNDAQDQVEISVDATGAATKHQVEAAQGKLDIFMSSPTIYHLMANGQAMYLNLASAPELSNNVRLLFWFPYGAYHIVAYDGSGIETMADLRDKKVFLGPPGGGAFNTAKAWVETNTGMVPGEDFESVKASWGSALQGFQDRQFDVYISGGIPPYPQIEQLALTSKIRLIGLSGADYENASDEVKTETTKLGRTVEIIPEGIYGENVVSNGDVYTVGATVGVAARADLDEEKVYLMTKTFWENLPEAQANAPYLNEVSLEVALRSDRMKLHPGALRYYEEIGLEIPEAMR
ncbi:MAG: TAXI family TRAP transporter solute-binding subunit [Geminicoccaceae bacterium]